MVPNFATAHLLVAACLIAAVSGLMACSLSFHSGDSLFAIFAVELGSFAVFGWLAHRYSAVIVLSFCWVSSWARNGTFETPARVYDFLIPESAGASSVVMMLISLAGLSALALRLIRFREEMSGYNIAATYDRIGNSAARSSSRSQQQLEARAVSKSVVFAWIFDKQFHMALKYLPKSWLP